MNNKKTELIILSEQKYQESSKIIKVFTKEFGKMTVLAKGALRSKSSLVSSTQVFTHIIADVTSGKSFAYISDVLILNSNINLRKDYRTLVMSSYLLELVDKSFLEGEVNKKIFDLLIKTLLLIQKDSSKILPFVIAFEIKYISFLGYKPFLDTQLENTFFSVYDGGVVDFYEEKSGVYSISQKDIYYIKKLLYTSLNEVENYDEERLLYLQNILVEYIKYNLDISEFNSLLLI